MLVFAGSSLSCFGTCDTFTIGANPTAVCVGTPVPLTANYPCTEHMNNLTATWGGDPAVGSCSGTSCSATFSTPGCRTITVHIEADNDAGTHYCADGTVTIAVVSVTQADTSIWWFNGEDALNYHESTTLTADKGTCGGAITWVVTAGMGKVVIVNPSANPATVNSTANASDQENDVTIACKYDGVPVCSVSLTVRSPFSMEPSGNPNFMDQNWGSDGYKSRIKYKILDQLGAVLPNPVEWNETFVEPLGQEISDFPGENWIHGLAGGDIVPTNPFVDVVSAKNNATGGSSPGYPTAPGSTPSGYPRIPGCVHAQPPHADGGIAVHHFNGTFYIGHAGTIGGQGSGRGVAVKFVTWQNYRGKGRHL